MRSRRSLCLLLVFAFFGLYGVTAGPLTGYESETAAVSEGLVRTGQLHIVFGTALSDQGIPGRNGQYYSRTGLTQPVLEAPFYWVGQQLDAVSAGGAMYRWRKLLVELFEPAMAAIAIAAIYLLLVLRDVPDRRALMVAVLAGSATLIWPYSKIGMDTTLMTSFAVTLATAAWCAQRPGPARFLAVGVACGVTMNAKGYGALLCLGVLPLLWQPIRAAVRTRRLADWGCLITPMLVGVTAVGWYNWYRTGSVSNFAEPYYQDVLGVPFNALGLFVSPGKGLLWYSPLVGLGLVAAGELRARDRALWATICLSVGANVLIFAASAAWSDETWGPRYIVPTAWLLVVPLAYWATSARRRRWLAAVGAVGVCVQLIGVLPAYGGTFTTQRALTGVPVYDWPPGVNAVKPPPAIVTPSVPYGDDAARWIPKLSPLLIQTEVIGAWLSQAIVGHGFTVTYAPFRGQSSSLSLRHTVAAIGPLPDFWWTLPDMTDKEILIAALLIVLAVAGAGGLVYVVSRHQVSACQHRDLRDR